MSLALGLVILPFTLTISFKGTLFAAVMEISPVVVLFICLFSIGEYSLIISLKDAAVPVSSSPVLLSASFKKMFALPTVADFPMSVTSQRIIR